MTPGTPHPPIGPCCCQAKTDAPCPSQVGFGNVCASCLANHPEVAVGGWEAIAVDQPEQENQEAEGDEA